MEIKVCNNARNKQMTGQKQSLINVYTLSGRKIRSMRWLRVGWVSHAQNMSMATVSEGGNGAAGGRTLLINVVLIMIMADVASCCTVERKCVGL